MLARPFACRYAGGPANKQIESLSTESTNRPYFWAKVTTTTKENKMAVTMKRVLVTPEMAAKWLDGHQNFRNMRKGFMLRLVADMKAGNFHDIGDPIRFDSSGALVDGQHRLAAIVESGVSISMHVAHGVDRVEVVDSGTPRSVSDTLNRTMAVPSANSATAAIRRLHRTQLVDISGAKQNAGISLTNSQIVSYVENHPELITACTDAGNMRGSGASAINYSDAILVLHFAQLKNLDYAAVLSFLESVRDGCGLYKGDPELTLRERLISMQGAARNDSGGFARTYFFLRALRAKLDGEKLVLLRYIPGETTYPKF